MPSRIKTEQHFLNSWFENNNKRSARKPKRYKAEQRAHPGTAQYYLQLANRSRPPQKQNYQIMAAEKLMDNGNYNQAEVLLKNIDCRQLNATTIAHIKIAFAEVRFAQNNFNSALDNLEDINTEQLPFKLYMRYHEVKIASLTKNNKLAEALKNKIILNSYAHYRSTWHQHQIWDMVLELSPQQLAAANSMTIANQTENNLLHGWVELGILTKKYQSSELQFNRAFRQWEGNYSNHPGSMVINKPQEKKVSIRNPRKVALLLPIHGEHQQAAKIIRDGFFANYYHDKFKQNSPQTIKVYDTKGGNNVIQAYKQAINDRADIIIGPLTKQAVINLAQQDLTIPVIALNTTSKAASKINMYQFGLVPELEVAAVVRRAKQSAMHKALILVPDSAWGRRLAEAFSSQWQRLGGTTIDIGYFAAPNTYNDKIKQLLKIQDSNVRAQELEKILGTAVQHNTERRQDIDVIFMAMPNNMARQVKPLLNFYYARELPVFATSSIYSGKVNSEKDRDLDGIVFCDMPWLLDNNKDFGNASAMGENLQGPRLFALGMDAYLLANNVAKLSNYSNATVQGASGLLSVDDLHRVVRRPIWAKFVNGKPEQVK